MAVDSTGNVYVCNGGSSVFNGPITIEKYPAAGGSLSTIASFPMFSAAGMATNSTGTFDVLESNEIWQMTSGGATSSITQIPTTGNGIIVNASGDIFVSNGPGVERVYPAMGATEYVAGVPETSASPGPPPSGPVAGIGTSVQRGDAEGMAIDATGDIYVADYGDNAVWELIPEQ